MANQSIFSAFERMWQHINARFMNKDRVQYVTQAEYDALGDAANTDGVLYVITDKEDITLKYVTKAEYDALGDSVNDDEVFYIITDSKINAKDIEFDNFNTNITFSNTTNYTPVSIGTNLSSRNGIISLDGVIQVNSPSSSWLTVATINSKYAPKNTIYYPCLGWSDGTNAPTTLDVGILTDGSIQLRRGLANSVYYMHISY